MEFDILQYLNPTKLINARRDKLQAAVNAAERYNPNPKIGLDSIIVLQRQSQGLVNKKKKVVTKTYLRIFIDNFFSFFNILIFSLGVLAAIAGKYNQLLFLGIITINCVIGIVQDIRARKLVDKLSIINRMKSTVKREGKDFEIPSTELVLDDLVVLKSGEQVPADCIIVSGKCACNEAMLTGEPDSVKKKVNDTLLSGTYISSGTCLARVNKIGMLNASEEIQAKASMFRKPKSEILKSLNLLFRVVGFIVVILGLMSLLSYWYINPSEFTWEKFAGAPMTNDGYISSFIGTMVAMIPAGLSLLTSVALSVGVISLSKKKCLVQELYSIEMLARVDTLCLDKTGTITDGTMKFTKYIKINRGYNEDEAGQIIRSIISATRDDSYTTRALLEKFGQFKVIDAKNTIPFSSEIKLSAAYFEGFGTFAIGAFGYIDIENQTEVQKIIKQYSAKGYRCIVLCKSRKKILGDSLPNDMVCLGVVVLEDHIRESAAVTFKWFKENGVSVNVISGDDPVTVSEISKKVGIDNYDQYVSLEGKSIEEVSNIAGNYTIYGRVSPEQKEALIISLKRQGKTVAMTGDGVNDILALKRADCSIAMNSGSDAAKNVSHLVLINSDFSVLPSVVAEGRRVINNLQRTSALFLSKTIFTILAAIVFITLTFATANENMIFPLQTNNYYLWETACVGVGGFFLSLEPNATQINGKFLPNAVRKALPISISLLFVIMAYFIVFVIDEKLGGHQIMSIGMVGEGDELKTLDAMASIAMVIIGFVSLFRICIPFTKYRAGVFGGLLVLTIVTIAIAYSIYFPSGNSIGDYWFAFDIKYMSLIDWLWTLVFLEAGIFAYIYVDKFLDKVNFEKHISKFKGRTNHED